MLYSVNGKTVSVDLTADFRACGNFSPLICDVSEQAVEYGMVIHVCVSPNSCPTSSGDMIRNAVITSSSLKCQLLDLGGFRA
jgi:hypothetical protein